MANKTDLVPIKFYDILYVRRMNDKGREPLCLFPPWFQENVGPCGALLSPFPPTDAREDSGHVPWCAAGGTWPQGHPDT